MHHGTYAIDDEPNEIVATHDSSVQACQSRTHWHSLIARLSTGLSKPYTQIDRTPLCLQRDALQTLSDVDTPPTARRGRSCFTTATTTDAETRTRSAPAAAAGPGRGTRHSSFDITNTTGAHAVAWHALESGATCSLPASLPHYDEPKLGPFTATTKDVPDATLPRAALCQTEHTGPFPLACLIVHGIQ